MEKSSIENLKKMSIALEELASAWYNVSKLWDDPEVMEIMSNECDLYPFDRSFDEITIELDDWAYLASNKLKECAIAEEQQEKRM